MSRRLGAAAILLLGVSTVGWTAVADVVPRSQGTASPGGALPPIEPVTVAQRGGDVAAIAAGDPFRARRSEVAADVDLEPEQGRRHQLRLAGVALGGRAIALVAGFEGVERALPLEVGDDTLGVVVLGVWSDSVTVREGENQVTLLMNGREP